LTNIYQTDHIPAIDSMRIIVCWRPLWTSGVPRVSRARGQSQFGRPYPVCSWQYRCEGWVGS